jgi:Laminin G domain
VKALIFVYLYNLMVFFNSVGYVKLQAGTFVGGENTDIQFGYRSEQSNGILLFAFGGTGTYYLVQFVNSTLQWIVSANGVAKSLSFNASLATLCDGLWHKVRLVSVGLHLRITVDGIQVESNDLQSSSQSVNLASYLYVGGIPVNDDEAVQFISVNGVKVSLQNSK